MRIAEIITLDLRLLHRETESHTHHPLLSEIELFIQNSEFVSKTLKSRSINVRNMRLAYLNKLVSEGHYFSKDSMRVRETYLHHKYVGKFQDLMGTEMARPGESWSETLMRKTEEATLVSRIREKQQRLGVAESDWIGNNEKMEEPEDDEEEEEESEEEEEESEDDEEAKKIPREASSSHEEKLQKVLKN